jgi:hypothetical protein
MALISREPCWWVARGVEGGGGDEREEEEDDDDDDDGGGRRRERTNLPANKGLFSCVLLLCCCCCFWWCFFEEPAKILKIRGRCQQRRGELREMGDTKEGMNRKGGVNGREMSQLYPDQPC